MNDPISIYQIAKQHEQNLRQQVVAARRASTTSTQQSVRQRAGQALIALGQRLQGAPRSCEMQTLGR